MKGDKERRGHRSSVTSVDSSKDRIIIPDQAQRRSNLDEVKVQRCLVSSIRDTYIRSLDVHTYRGRGWGKWCKSLGGK